MQLLRIHAERLDKCCSLPGKRCRIKLMLAVHLNPLEALLGLIAGHYPGPSHRLPDAIDYHIHAGLQLSCERPAQAV